MNYFVISYNSNTIGLVFASQSVNLLYSQTMLYKNVMSSVSGPMPMHSKLPDVHADMCGAAKNSH